jgi:hypothetical protein
MRTVRPRRWKVLAIAAAALAAAAAAGCGDEPPAKHEVDVVFGDCSPSFEERSGAYVEDMVAVARGSAEHDRSFYAGCVDGAPLRTLDWAVEKDFAAVEASNSGDHARIVAAMAEGTKPKLEAMLRTPREVPGSGQLEALELASQIDGLSGVWLFSDAIVRQVGAVDLETSDAATVDSAAREWARRMGDGLDAVTVTFVGGGQGAPSTEAARLARRLLEGVVEDAGGTPLWSQTTAFPQGEG